MPEPARWLDAGETAELLRISRNQLSRLVTLHHVPIIRINRRDVRFDEIAITALREACRSESSGAPTQGRSTSSARSPQRAPRPDTEYDNALALIEKMKREKKQPRSNSRSSATTTSATARSNVTLLRP